MIKPFRQDYKLSQSWGENPATYAQFGIKGHNGLDYAVPNATEIIAPHSGKVIEAAFDAGGYGLYLKIENEKEGSVLAHLKENYVAVGAIVSEGQLIASSDNTGFSNGPHLHWGYYKIPRNRQDGYLGYINQLPLLTPSVPLEDIVKLQTKIRDLEVTNSRLITEKDAVVKEKDEIVKKLALKDQECLTKLQSYKDKVLMAVKNTTI